MTPEEYVQGLNQVFSRHGLRLRIEVSDLNFATSFVMDSINPDRRISSYLTTQISPPVDHGEYFHYTRGDIADKILNSGVMRLTTIQKRIAEHEIREFLERFGYDYPLGTDPGSSVPRFHESIASQVFYTSFTDTNLSELEEKHFWESFAYDDGARLKFRLSRGSGCFRRMAYGSQIDRWARLYREISDFTKISLGKVFYWDNASTVCALLLPDIYNVEKETRLIARRNFGLPMGKDGDYEYLEARIGYNPVIDLQMDLIEIQTNRAVTNSWGATILPRARKI